MNRRAFLREILGLAAASVAAKVAPIMKATVPKRGAPEGIRVRFGQFTPLLGSLRMRVNLNGAGEEMDADAVLPLYIDDYGDLREASGRLARYMALDNEGIDTRQMRDVSDWTTPEARLLVESINSHYGRTAEMLPYIAGITEGSEQAIRDYVAGLKVT